MKRATITFPDELEAKLDTYLAQQQTPPSLSTVVQTALENFLEGQKWAAYQPQPAIQPFHVTVAEEGGDADDVSLYPDAYSAAATSIRKVNCEQGDEAADDSTLPSGS